MIPLDTSDTRGHRRSSGFALCMRVGIGVLGSCFLLASSLQFTQVLAIGMWPTTAAQIDVLDVIETSVRSQRRTQYVILLKYHYEVMGKKYDGNRFSHQPIEFRNKEQAIELLHSLVSKGMISVHYDPKEPKYSFVLPISNLFKTVIAPLLSGLFLLILSLFYPKLVDFGKQCLINNFDQRWR